MKRVVLLNRKHLLAATLGSASVISTAAYFGRNSLSIKLKTFGHNNSDNSTSSSSTQPMTTDINNNNNNNSNDYIYLDKDINNESSSQMLAEYSEDGVPSDSRTHLQLLRLAQYRPHDRLQVTEVAISAIANTNFNDHQYREIAQSCDYETALRLARIPGVSPKLFMPPLNTYYFQTNQSAPIHDFERFLLNLFKNAQNSGHRTSDCTKFFTKLSIEMLETGCHSRQLEDMVDFTDIHLHYHRRRSASEVNWVYLQAISQNILSSDKLQCQTLVNNGLFLILHYLRNNFTEKAVHDWIAQTLANLSAHREFHSHFWTTNWFGVLVNWLHSNRLEWSLPAAKVLHNLSQELDDHLLPESIYLLHPIFHDTQPKDFDIILVHGLLGGAFKTWRQCDSEKQYSPQYTRCWPQTWLANDVADVRLFAVNYQTFLSNWNIECNDDNSVTTLKQRSAQFLNDLISSPIGDKPIIWITHSMGGLIVKQMLVDVSESNDPRMRSLLDQTKGIVFYSVPHKGTEMAVWTPYLQRIISPSTELLQLRKDSQFLLSLHTNFLKLIRDKPIECLSFGETVKSCVIKRPFKWSRLLVPEESANPGVGDFHLLAVDHFNTCKPKDKTSDAYHRVVSFINHIIETNRPPNDSNNSYDKINVLLMSIFD
ncbi:protein SERAC1-like [Oppia nitens]|uniref:protein SERAC1-like n=1 Tax=Oppia nitens TaxID=1686743 RepID=UPI0023D9BE85|nr:protein SERAC1-like [Oppia nitens]